MALGAWFFRAFLPTMLLIQSLLSGALGYDLDLDSEESIRSTATGMAEDMLTFYNGNKPGHTPGLLELPYYWWYGGAMFGALIDYWYYTGDTRFNDLTSQGMLFQVGDERDYMPQNQTLTEGNDDQGFWGLAAMQAAEYNFPNPPPGQPQWLALAQAVFNTQAARWDTSQCGGGLRWQIFTWNKGYDYKNSISQACFFALGARLALFTGNTTYADWAERTWDWMVDIKFIDTETYWIVDGANLRNNCGDRVPYLFTYNAGGFLLGAAAMYNLTGSDTWRDRLDGLVRGLDVFFQGDDGGEGDTMVEVACEPVDNCNYDQESFKAYLSRWMAVAAKWAPHIDDRVRPRLRASAIAAAKQCTGGANGRMCGLKWVNNNNGSWDGTTGLGNQMAALNVVVTQLAHRVGAPLTADSGATSVGDPNAGSGDIGRSDNPVVLAPVTVAQEVGAAILTAAVLAGLIAGVVFMFADESAAKTAPERWSDFRAEVREIGAAMAAVGTAMMCCCGAGRRGGLQEGEELGEDKGKGPELPVTEPRAGGGGASSGTTLSRTPDVPPVPPIPAHLRDEWRAGQDTTAAIAAPATPVNIQPAIVGSGPQHPRQEHPQEQHPEQNHPEQQEPPLRSPRFPRPPPPPRRWATMGESPNPDSDPNRPRQGGPADYGVGLAFTID